MPRITVIETTTITARLNRIQLEELADVLFSRGIIVNEILKTYHLEDLETLLSENNPQLLAAEIAQIPGVMFNPGENTSYSAGLAALNINGKLKLIYDAAFSYGKIIYDHKLYRQICCITFQMPRYKFANAELDINEMITLVYTHEDQKSYIDASANLNLESYAESLDKTRKASIAVWRMKYAKDLNSVESLLVPDETPEQTEQSHETPGQKSKPEQKSALAINRARSSGFRTEKQLKNSWAFQIQKSKDKGDFIKNFYKMTLYQKMIELRYRRVIYARNFEQIQLKPDELAKIERDVENLERMLAPANSNCDHYKLYNKMRRSNSIIDKKQLLQKLNVFFKKPINHYHMCNKCDGIIMCDHVYILMSNLDMPIYKLNKLMDEFNDDGICQYCGEQIYMGEEQTSFTASVNVETTRIGEIIWKELRMVLNGIKFNVDAKKGLFVDANKFLEQGIETLTPWMEIVEKMAKKNATYSAEQIEASMTLHAFIYSYVLVFALSNNDPLIEFTRPVLKKSAIKNTIQTISDFIYSFKSPVIRLINITPNDIRSKFTSAYEVMKKISSGVLTNNGDNIYEILEDSLLSIPMIYPRTIEQAFGMSIQKLYNLAMQKVDIFAELIPLRGLNDDLQLLMDYVKEKMWLNIPKSFYERQEKNYVAALNARNEVAPLFPLLFGLSNSINLTNTTLNHGQLSNSINSTINNESCLFDESGNIRKWPIYVYVNDKHDINKNDINKNDNINKNDKNKNENDNKIELTAGELATAIAKGENPVANMKLADFKDGDVYLRECKPVDVSKIVYDKYKKQNDANVKMIAEIFDVAAKKETTNITEIFQPVEKSPAYEYDYKDEQITTQFEDKFKFKFGVYTDLMPYDYRLLNMLNFAETLISDYKILELSVAGSLAPMAEFYRAEFEPSTVPKIPNFYEECHAAFYALEPNMAYNAITQLISKTFINNPNIKFVEYHIKEYQSRLKWLIMPEFINWALLRNTLKVLDEREEQVEQEKDAFENDMDLDIPEDNPEAIEDNLELREGAAPPPL